MRQLHNYGFKGRQLDGGAFEYRHEGFVKGKPDLLANIHRREKTVKEDTVTRSDIDSLRKENEDLRKELNELRQHQYRIAKVLMTAIAPPAPAAARVKRTASDASASYKRVRSVHFTEVIDNADAGIPSTDLFQPGSQFGYSGSQNFAAFPLMRNTSLGMSQGMPDEVQPPASAGPALLTPMPSQADLAALLQAMEEQMQQQQPASSAAAGAFAPTPSTVAAAIAAVAGAGAAVDGDDDDHEQPKLSQEALETNCPGSDSPSSKSM